MRKTITNLLWDQQAGSFPKCWTGTFVGFDSAWTISNHGALALLCLKWNSPTPPNALGNMVLEFVTPESCNFIQAAKRLAEIRQRSDLTVAVIDQPMVVPNDAGQRPVEGIVSSLAGALGGAVQPANRSKAQMFGADAPIWSFLQTEIENGASLNFASAPGATKGYWLVEGIPMFSIVGAIPRFEDRMAKYNPQRRRSFRPSDWRNLCTDIGSIFRRLKVQVAPVWCQQKAALDRPKKADQDQLDAVICALTALQFWLHGFRRCVAVGDVHKGYMVFQARRRHVTALHQRRTVVERRERLQVPIAWQSSTDISTSKSPSLPAHK